MYVLATTRRGGVPDEHTAQHHLHSKRQHSPSLTMAVDAAGGGGFEVAGPDYELEKGKWHARVPPWLLAPGMWGVACRPLTQNNVVGERLCQHLVAAQRSYATSL